jgi:hypothetical protein
MVASHEVTMHIHATQMNINAINPYSAAADRAVAAQRAADLRKKLLKNVANLEASSSPEEARMIGQWLEAGQSRAENEDQYHASATGNKPAF